MLELLEESKALKQLKLPLPLSVLSLLSQEKRIKDFQQQLQYQIDQLTTAISNIDTKLLPLYDNVIDTVLRYSCTVLTCTYCVLYRYYLPGWTTLTWATLNIDPFLHQLSTATSLLHTLVDTTNDILTNRVYQTLDSISRLSLIDFEYIASKIWVGYIK